MMHQRNRNDTPVHKSLPLWRRYDALGVLLILGACVTLFTVTEIHRRRLVAPANSQEVLKTLLKELLNLTDDESSPLTELEILTVQKAMNFLEVAGKEMPEKSAYHDLTRVEWSSLGSDSSTNGNLDRGIPDLEEEISNIEFTIRMIELGWSKSTKRRPELVQKIKALKDEITKLQSSQSTDARDCNGDWLYTVIIHLLLKTELTGTCNSLAWPALPDTDTCNQPECYFAGTKNREPERHEKIFCRRKENWVLGPGTERFLVFKHLIELDPYYKLSKDYETLIRI